MRSNVRNVVLLCVGLALSLSACEQIRETAGIQKKAPDEFAVVRNAPLSVPPDYDLRPPRPGARAIPQLDPRREAEQATFGRQAAAATVSTAESASEKELLQTLHVGSTPPGIRQQVDEESAILASDNTNFVENLMFWRKDPPPGVVVNARGEQNRIQENSALGRPPDTGTTPTIERKSNAGISLF